MKKTYLFGLLSLFTLLFATSCQQEDAVDAQSANTEMVTYTVSTQQVATRTAEFPGQGLQATKLYYGVYEWMNNGWSLIETNSVLAEANALSITAGVPMEVPIRLAKQKKYSVIFWAQSAATEKPLCNVDWAGRKMTINTELLSNQEAYDAFWAYDEVEVNGAISKKVDLVRPFAQLNIGTSDFADAEKASVNVNGSAVAIKGLPTTLDFATGAVAESADENYIATYANAAIPAAENWKYPVDGYGYLALNYVLVGKDQTLIDVALSYTDDEGLEYSNTFTAVPVKRNYRTNIYGSLLTNVANYTVDIKPVFTEPAENIEIWDGESVEAPVIDEPNKTVTLSHPNHLAWLAASVNGTLPASRAEGSVEPNTYKGWTITLAEDVDLGDKEWTPIGNSTNQFQGTFDGGGKTVYNLNISGNNSNVGLFGMTTNGEIKNVIVENAKVSGRLNVAVVAGCPYTSMYTNITVKGHVEVNGMAYVGGVGGKNAYANWTNITVDADETSYVKANSVENGTAYRTYVGGVCGFNGEGGHTFKNITSNIDVIGSTIDAGGLFGIAHYGNKFVNCSSSGDVEITDASDAADAEEIGGIAGVWNNGGADVVFTDCSFTGTLKTNITEGVELYDNIIVGSAYSATGNGKLIITNNGKSIEFIADGVMKENDDYCISKPAGLVWLEAQEDKFFGTKTIKLTSDIDMTGVTLEKPIHFWGNRATFDGQNHTISNLTMTTQSTEKKPFGLFGGTADIKNVKFDNVNISGYSYVAVVAGNIYGNIDNCHVSNSSVTCTYWMAGALSGQYNSGNVTNCSVTNTTITGPAAVGALVGVINETAGERKVENCVVTNCTVAQNGSFGGSYDEMFGAAVGLININDSKVDFNNCQVENVTIKGASSTQLYGVVNESTTVYVDGYELVAEGVKLRDEVYYISNAAGLKWIADIVNATTPYTPILFDGKTVKLMNDIDLNNEEWIPIGDDRSQRTEWHGIFDGQGYAIKNVKITKKTDREDENKSSYGLFGNVKGTVKNLIVENVSISGAPKFIGALVGRLNDGLIENCQVKNSSVECENWTIGGLVGQFNNGKISGCTVENTTIKGYAAVGAIAGIALNNGERTIENCTVRECTIVKNGSFGGNFDKMFGSVLGAINSGDLTVNLNGCNVANTTIEGKASEKLCGYFTDGDILYVDGIMTLVSSNNLVWFANEVNVNKNAYTGKTVTLGADIDLAGIDWEPIGQTGATTFNGVFDGQNYTISNLSVDSEDQTGAHYSSGLFGWVESHTAGQGHIKNVKINGATIKGHHNCGALVGYITQQTALVENCHVTGATVSCTVANSDANGDKAGALIGNATVATPVKDCTAANSTVSSGRDAGQVIGAGKEANVTGCSATEVTVTANGTGTGANVRNEVIGRLL